MLLFLLCCFFSCVMITVTKYINLKERCEQMEPILGISLEDILAFIEKALATIKELFAKIGILILPEKDELPTQAQ